MGYAQKFSTGRSGGLLFLWDKNIWISDQIITGDSFLGIIGEWRGKRFKFLLLNVYGPQLTSQKRELWSQLRLLIQNFRGSVCVMGDFNVVRRPSERSGSRFKPIRAADFNSLSDTTLIDVKQRARCFTWVSWDGLKMSKLDRFLINLKFTEEWEDVTVVVRDRVFSDHCPVLLKDNGIDFGPPPFRCFDYWLTMPGFTAMVKEVWVPEHFSGAADYILKEKLKGLKKGITSWRNSTHPGITSSVDAIKSKFLPLERQA